VEKGEASENLFKKEAGLKLAGGREKDRQKKPFEIRGEDTSANENPEKSRGDAKQKTGTHKG